MSRPRTIIPVSYKAEFEKYWAATFGNGPQAPGKAHEQIYVDVPTFAAKLGLAKDSVRNMIEERRIFALKLGRYKIVVPISRMLIFHDAIWENLDADAA